METDTYRPTAAELAACQLPAPSGAPLAFIFVTAALGRSLHPWAVEDCDSAATAGGDGTIPQFFGGSDVILFSDPTTPQSWGRSRSLADCDHLPGGWRAAWVAWAEVLAARAGSLEQSGAPDLEAATLQP